MMAEWLRRWTRNPMGYSRTGSNPVHSVSLIFFTFKKCLWLAMMGHENLGQGSISCDGRVVKALDLKSNGQCPRRFEPCSQRHLFAGSNTAAAHSKPFCIAPLLMKIK